MLAIWIILALSSFFIMFGPVIVNEHENNSLRDETYILLRAYLLIGAELSSQLLLYLLNENGVFLGGWGGGWS